MIYGSICSGIEAASAAWHPLGWRAAFLSEIEPFPRAVLQHHYPDVPLHGDFTTIREGDYAAIDLLVGGTPCQSFSVAGLRKGLDDDRGNLALEYLRLADRLRPRWLVWENVPGVLSSNGGRDFGSILGGMVELGYGFAYRVLDAQYVRVDGFGRAVPQRRRRVFVVGCAGSWQRAAAVLFERESLCGNPAPRRQAGQDVAHSVTTRAGNGSRPAGATGNVVAFGGNNQSGPIDVATAQTAHGGTGRIDFESETFVAHALRADGFDASEDGTGRGVVPCLSPACGVRGLPLVPVAAGARPPTIAFRTTGNDGAYECGDVAPCLATGTDPNHTTLLQHWRVRRLTPVECERLQGFPDDFTAIPMRNKNGKLNGKWAKDGPRYKALGNSFAVNVVRWIGQRIQMVEGTYGSD